MYSVSVHYKSFHVTTRLQLHNKKNIWAVLCPRQWRNWQSLLRFRFFPWLMVEVRPSVFLEQSPRALREFISLTWCLSSWAVCGQELLQHTQCTHSPVQLSSDLSSWKKGGVRTSSCKRSHQSVCSWLPKHRTSEILQVIPGHVGLAVSSSSCILFLSVEAHLPQHTVTPEPKALLGLLVFFKIQFIFSITLITEMNNNFKTISDDFLYKQYQLSWFRFSVCK